MQQPVKLGIALGKTVDVVGNNAQAAMCGLPGQDQVSGKSVGQGVVGVESDVAPVMSDVEHALHERVRVAAVDRESGQKAVQSLPGVDAQAQFLQVEAD